MAPEILRYEKYDAKADLWSVGAVTYEMCTGKPPFRAQNHVELLRRIERGEDRIKFPNERPSMSAAGKEGSQDFNQCSGANDIIVSEDIKELIRKLLRRNPLERMNFSDFFTDAEAVARWGEESIAPGRIDSNNTLTGRSSEMALSGSPLNVKILSSIPQHRGQSSDNVSILTSKPTIPASEQQHVLPLLPPIPMPSTNAEQEPAFARLPLHSQPQSNLTLSPLPNSAGDPASPVVGNPPISENPSNASSLNYGAESQQYPTLLQRKGTFAPKYIVGPSLAAEKEESVVTVIPIKTRDFAIPAQAVVNPQANASKLESCVTSAPARSNLSLALPANFEREQQLSASGMTGDDDSILGREYVVVEKRNVEVNALADGELSRAGRGLRLERLLILYYSRIGCTAKAGFYPFAPKFTRFSLSPIERDEPFISRLDGQCYSGCQSLAPQSSFALSAFGST